MSIEKIGVMIATPLKDLGEIKQLHPDFLALMQEVKELTLDPDCPYAFEWATVDMGMIPARNRIADNFLKGTCKWLYWCDYDVVPCAAQILQLLSKKLPVIGALYTTQEEKPHWVATFLFEAERQKETVLQVVECGLGGKLYHRQVFEELIRIYPQIAYTDRDSGEQLHGFFQHLVVFHDLQQAGDLLPEDFFCDYLCRMCKISVWVDTSVRIRHRAPDGALYPKGNWPPIPGLEPSEEKVIHLKKPKKKHERKTVR